jgi:hypothetical protein
MAEMRIVHVFPLPKNSPRFFFCLASDYSSLLRQVSDCGVNQGLGLVTHSGCSSLVLLSLFASFSKQKAAQPTMPKFSELSHEDRTRLEQQRAVVAAAAKQRYGTSSLTKTASDLSVLQRLIDGKVFRKMQTYELQSLGIAFGDVLASELPLRWVMVTDEYGTDPTLRFKATTVQINALTMISKRIEKDKDVNLSELLRITREQLTSLSESGKL